MIDLILFMIIPLSFSCSIENCGFCSTKDPRICLNCNPGYIRDSLQGCLALPNSHTHNWRIENCLKLENSTCINCLDGFSLTSGYCEPICESEDCTCFSPGTCLHSKRSLSCTKDCLICSANDNVCDECKLSYGLDSDHECIKCSTDYCKNCGENYQECSDCNNGYSLDSDRYCTRCSDPHCLKCDHKDDSCLECNPSYGLSSYGVCLSCASDNCFNCSENYKICKICSEHYGLDSNGNCLRCDNNNCKYCNYNSFECSDCFPGKGLDSYGNCINCTDTQCSDCKNNYLHCEACNEGYGLNNHICTNCYSQRCLSCSRNYYFCSICDACYVVNSYGFCNNYYAGTYCYLCSENCEICDHYTCIRCESGFGLNSSGLCDSACDSRGCLRCSDTGRCITCDKDFILDKNGICCDLSCLTCSYDSKRCESCPEGMYLNIYCFNCPEGCKFCTNGEDCYDCESGYHLSNLKCISNDDSDSSSGLSKYEIIIITYSLFGGCLLAGIIYLIIFLKRRHSKKKLDIPEIRPIEEKRILAKTKSSVKRKNETVSQSNFLVSPAYAQTIVLDREIEPIFKKAMTAVKLDSCNSYNGINFCKICGNTFNDHSEVESLPCGHPYHSKCLTNCVANEKLNFCLICMDNFY